VYYVTRYSYICQARDAINQIRNINQFLAQMYDKIRSIVFI